MIFKIILTCSVLFSTHLMASEDLLYYAKKGDSKKVIKILDSGADVNYRNDNGWSALTFSTSYNRLETAEILLKRNAEIRIELGWCKSISMAQLLIKYGAEINYKTDSNITPLYLLVAWGSLNLDLVKYYFSIGANPKVSPKNSSVGIVSLKTWDRQMKDPDLRKKRNDLVNFLLLNNSPFDGHGKSLGLGVTSLGNAIKWGFLDVLESLLKMGLDPNQVAANQNVAAYDAIFEDKTEALKLLIRYKLKLDYIFPWIKYRRSSNVSLLGLASLRRHTKTKTLLLESGIDPRVPLYGCPQKNWHCFIQSQLGNSSLEFDNALLTSLKKFRVPIDYKDWSSIVRRENAISHVKLFLQHGFDVSTSLFFAWINKGSREVIKYLIANGADPNQVNNKGIPPVHLYSPDQPYSIEAIKTLIEHGANVNSHYGYQDFICKVVMNFDLLKFVITKGANVNGDCGSGSSPLYRPFQYLHKKDADRIFRYLIRSGTKINNTNKIGETILTEYYGQVSTKACRLFIEFNGDPNIADNKGETALHKAAKWTSYKNSIDKLNCLLEGKIDVNSVDIKKRSSLMVLLKEFPRSDKDAQLRHKMFFDILINEKADIRLQDMYNRTALEYAANERNFYPLEILVDLGFDINRRSHSFFKYFGNHTDGFTPLMHAVDACFPKSVRFLLEKGTDKNLRDERGKDAKYYAERKNLTCAREILEILKNSELKK